MIGVHQHTLSRSPLFVLPLLLPALACGADTPASLEPDPTDASSGTDADTSTPTSTPTDESSTSAVDSTGDAPEPSCGNEIVEDGEACDDGDRNGTPGLCAADCQGPATGCGDGLVQAGETCDDGNAVDGDGCNQDCRESGLWPVVRSRSLGTVACGERWPAQAIGLDDHGCADNRRVEILFFDLDDLPDLTHPEPGYDVYGSNRYRIVPVPPRPRIRLIRFQIRDSRGVPLPDTEYEITAAEGAHLGTTDAHGFTQRFLAVEGEPAAIWVHGLYYWLCSAVDGYGPMVARSVLNALGHYAGPVIETNERQGRAAIRNFQWLHGLPITGQLDAETLTAVCDATGS